MEIAQSKKTGIRVNVLAVTVFLVTTMVAPAGYSAVGTTGSDNSVMPTGNTSTLRIDDTLSSSTSIRKVTSEERAEVKSIFGKNAATVEIVNLKGGTHCIYYDAQGNLIGRSSQTTGTQEEQPVKWYNPDGELVQVDSGIEPPERPGNDVTDPAVWQQYYADYIDYIDSLSDPDEKAQAWQNLTNDFRKLAANHPECLNAATFRQLSLAFADYLESVNSSEQAENSSMIFQARQNFLQAAMKFVQSDAFNGMSINQKSAVLSAFHNCSVQICRGVDFADNPEIFNQVGRVYQSIFSTQETGVKAQAFTCLMHFYRTFSREGYDSKGATRVLKTALNFEGGLESLLDDFTNDLNNNDLDDNTRGRIAVAMANLVYHTNHLNENTDTLISTKARNTLIRALSAFMGKVNDGKISLNTNVYRALMNMAGGVARQIVMNGDQDTKYGQNLINSFIEMAKNALKMSDEDGGNIRLRSAAVSQLIALYTRAERKGDTVLAQKTSRALFNNIDINEFTEQIQSALADNPSAAYAQVMARAMVNLIRLTLELDKADLSAETISQALQSIRKWLNEEGAADLRPGLFNALAGLAGQIYQSGSELAEDEEIGKYLRRIFSVVPGIQSEEVQKIIYERMEKLADQIRENGFNQMADQLEILTCPDSASLIAKAWEYYDAGNYASAIRFARALISRYSDQAAKQQGLLDDFAPAGKEARFWALNDVATAHFILGMIAKKKGDTDSAKEHFTTIIKKYGYAQCYDPQGWWWKVARAARKELKDL